MHRSILYIGSLEEFSNSAGRYKTLQAMGHHVRAIDIEPYIYRGAFAKLHRHLNIGPGIWVLNKKVIETIEEESPDILWVDNKPFLQWRTLRKIRKKWPSIKIINLITDDPAGRYRYAWRLCLKTAKYYDIHFVQRQINIAELKNQGARRVEICYRSYDPALHRPISLDGSDKEKYTTAVGFIGTHEIYREEYIVHLINNHIPVSITGNEWEKAKQWHIVQPYYKGPSVYGEEYVKTINGFGIALHFLRHVNRDEQDSRTFEIPACGAFMLAEKSQVHATLFEEDREAVFFETKEELLVKVRYYQKHVTERNAIAAAGHARCLHSGYSHKERLQGVLDIIFKS